MRKETEELIGKFGKLYKEGKTKKEIANLTHYSLNTVKQYLSIGGYLDKKRAFNKPQNDTVVKREEPPKKKIEKSKEEKKAEPIKETKPKRKQKEKKPYEILYDNIVIYKGQLYEKLSREDILDLMLNDMMIKKARKKKK